MEALVQLQPGKVVDLAVAVVVPTSRDFLVVLEYQDKEIAVEVGILTSVSIQVAAGVAQVPVVPMVLSPLIPLKAATGEAAPPVQSQEPVSPMQEVVEAQVYTPLLALEVQVVVVPAVFTAAMPQPAGQQIEAVAVVATLVVLLVTAAPAS